MLGLWIAEHEGVRFWLSVLTELRHRSVQGVFIACMDGLKGLPDAVTAIFPRCLLDPALCLVHIMRNSMLYISSTDIKLAVAMLKRIYQSASVEQAERELEAFEAEWGTKY